MAFNYGDIFATVAANVPPQRAALIHGDSVTTWQELDERSNRLARNLLAKGAKAGDKVAFYMRNHPAYMETLVAGFKASFTHVNVNYRYVEDELWYIMDNSDATVVVYSAEFAPRIAALQSRLPGVKQWVEVDDGHPASELGDSYETYAGNGDASALALNCSGDDQLFIYTGGTTGMPKGVMWRHEDLWAATGGGGNAVLGLAPAADYAELGARVNANPAPTTILPLPPLMHGTGLITSLGAMLAGGTVITIPGAKFDAELSLDLIDQHQVTSVTIVGDAFARPLLNKLDADPGHWKFSSVIAITSSGVMWSREIKQGLLKHNENLILADAFSSSEALGMGTSITTKDNDVEVAKFTLGEDCKVFTEDFKEVLAGSGQSGMVARPGPVPLGYYKDEAKTAKTFPTINGVRYSIPGDFVQVEADGTLTLLGRGSVCINTAGEKVFPEEVEEMLKKFPVVDDALVVGVADEKWGQAITAVVQLQPGSSLEVAELQSFARTKLAAYKVPKNILFKADLERAVNGKADYKSIKAFALAELQIEEVGA